MKKLLGWLGGTVTLQVAGEGLEGVLNRCAQGGISLATMRRQGDGSLLLQVSGPQWPRLRRLLGEGTWEVTVTGRRGLPYFLLHFRRRYALLAGLVLCLVAFAAGARTVLTIDVTGNVTVPTQVILSQLRLCGVSVGTYAPGIPIREKAQPPLCPLADRRLSCPSGGGRRLPAAGYGGGLGNLSGCQPQL